MNTVKTINHLMFQHEEITGCVPTGFHMLDLIESRYPDEDGLKMMHEYLDMTYTTGYTLSTKVQTVLDKL